MRFKEDGICAIAQNFGLFCLSQGILFAMKTYLNFCARLDFEINFERGILMAQMERTKL